MAIQGRKYTSSSSYRYGFNGKENDRETVGTGSGTQDYGLRIYNPALGRFLSTDPLQKEFAWNSSYAFAENDVIRSTDLDGAEKNFVFYFVVNGKRLEHIVPYAVVHPGQIQGPRGSGDYVSVRNEATKQFTGGYRESFADKRPIHNYFSSLDKSYQDEKGFYKKGLPTLIVMAGVLTAGASVAVEGGVLALSGTAKVFLVADAVSTANDASQILSITGYDGFLNKKVATTLSAVLLLKGGSDLIKAPFKKELAGELKTAADVINTSDEMNAGGAGLIADVCDLNANIYESATSESAPVETSNATGKDEIRE
jgi:RHS repeat-associated protein